jgi:hypothetical protein
MSGPTDRIDWKAADKEERRKFEEIQSFVAKCREHWPGAKIVIRASDSASIDLKPNATEDEMRTTDFYTSDSKYLRAADLSGKEMNPTIAGVTRGEFTNDTGAKAVKPVLEFRDMGQSLVLNKTNMGTLTVMFGDDMDRWAGKQIHLYGDRVPFRGKIVDTVRVGRPKAAAAQPSDDIPF